MKKTKILILIIILIGLLMFSCNKKTTEPKDTQQPTVFITYPANNSEFPAGSKIGIIADASDNEGIQKVEFYIDGEFSYSCETKPYEYEWNTGETKKEIHTIFVKAYDTSNNIGTSGVVNITLILETGNSPATPSNPNPANNATSVSTTMNLSWSCTDPDGDSLTYDVYFGTDPTPDNGELVSSGQGSTNYNLDRLGEETSYYWKIVARDNHGNSTSGTVWQFTTGGSGNQSPTVPINPNPANNATSVSTTINLSWSCTDPDGDPLIYDVYFGTDPSLDTNELVSTNQSGTVCNLETLEETTTYYWKIVAKDDHGNSTSGTVW